MSAITVHHLESSRSQRILLLLEELGLDYEIREYPRDPITSRAPAELKKLHPLGKAPVVTVGDVVLAESGAILEELVERFADGKLVPTDEDGRRLCRYFLHYSEGSLMPPLLVKLIFGRLRTAKVPFFIRPIINGVCDKVDASYTDPEVTRHFAFLNDHLADRIWLCGSEFSVADIQMSYPIEAAGQRVGYADYPHVEAYLARLKARPAWERMVKKGGTNQVPV